MATDIGAGKNTSVENPHSTCFCGEDLNDSGECWQGKIMGGHQGNCIICGKNAELDGMRCCSVECDQAAEEGEL